MEMIEFTRNGKREVAFVLGNVAMWTEKKRTGAGGELREAGKRAERCESDTEIKISPGGSLWRPAGGSLLWKDYLLSMRDFQKSPVGV